ncbi:MAG: hypothetical protein HYT61_00585 [Candidatus Yanofskybacteria bacterium]|nr:hypothetical protein [Candidatus Yanofskybacteria bacterium]
MQWLIWFLVFIILLFKIVVDIREIRNKKTTLREVIKSWGGIVIIPLTILIAFHVLHFSPVGSIIFGLFTLCIYIYFTSHPTNLKNRV